MAVYIVTGKLGNGKTLVTVGRIFDALVAGKKVATNLDLSPRWMFHRQKKDLKIIRIPDKPNLFDLELIGRGYEGKYDENKFGCLVLDECGTWFNSRNWQDKSRKAVNDWFLHARKLGWDVYLIIQDISILDSQAREALAEHTVFCRRLDNLRVPIIGGLFKAVFGVRLKLPRVHRAKVVYGQTAQDMVSDVWTYRGTNMFSWYDTQQIFSPMYEHGPYSMLTPWHIYGRHSVDMNWRNIMRITKIYWRRFKSPVALSTGMLVGAFVAFLRFAPEVVAGDKSIQPDVVAEPVADLVESPLASRLKNLYIAGSMKINKSLIHEFADRETVETVYTTKDLASMGLRVVPRGECRVEVTVDGEVIPIYCI